MSYCCVTVHIICISRTPFQIRSVQFTGSSPSHIVTYPVSLALQQSLPKLAGLGDDCRAFSGTHGSRGKQR